MANRIFLEIGHYFKIGDTFYLVQNREPFVYRYDKSVTADSESTKEEVSTLEPERDYVNHFLFGVYGPVGVKVFQPAATQRKYLKNTNIDFITSMESPYLYPDRRTEMVTVYGRPVSVIIKNLTSNNVNAKVRFTGYTYRVARVESRNLLDYLYQKEKTGGIPIFSVEGQVIE